MNKIERWLHVMNLRWDIPRGYVLEGNSGWHTVRLVGVNLLTQDKLKSLVQKDWFVWLEAGDEPGTIDLYVNMDDV